MKIANMVVNRLNWYPKNNFMDKQWIKTANEDLRAMYLDLNQVALGQQTPGNYSGTTITMKSGVVLKISLPFHEFATLIGMEKKEFGPNKL